MSRHIGGYQIVTRHERGKWKWVLQNFFFQTVQVGWEKKQKIAHQKAKDERDRRIREALGEVCQKIPVDTDACEQENAKR
jgi:hypothetical protein